MSDTPHAMDEDCEKGPEPELAPQATTEPPAQQGDSEERRGCATCGHEAAMTNHDGGEWQWVLCSQRGRCPVAYCNCGDWAAKESE